MKKFAIQLVALVAVILIGVYLSINSQIVGSYLNPFFKAPNITTQTDQSATNTNKLKVGEVIYKVDIADTDQERIKGFAGVENIAADYGMLFVFDKPEIKTFWMKGVKFPLDLVWIRDNAIVDITPNVQPPKENQPDELLPRYQSKEPVDKVLEIAGGSSSKNNIKIGDRISSVP